MLEIMWYNVNGLPGKSVDILNMLEQEDIDVLLLQETRILHQVQLTRLQKQLAALNYAILCEFPSRYLATIINTKNVTSYGSVHNGERLQVVRVECASETIYIANHYGPHKIDVPHYNYVKETMSSIASSGKVLFGGDHNAVVAKEDRTSGRKDPNTNCLISSMYSCNMQDINRVLGVHKFHTYFKRTMSSRIDSTWANKAALSVVRNIEAFTRNGALTDHIPTKVSVEVEHKTDGCDKDDRTSMVFPKNKLDSRWANYATEVLSDLSKQRIEDMSDPQTQCEMLTKVLVTRAVEFFGEQSTTKRWVDNRRVRRLIQSRKLVLDYLVSGTVGEHLCKVLTNYGGQTEIGRESVWSTLGIINQRLYQERTRHTCKRFRRWEWVARTSEFVNPSKFFSTASAKKSNRIRLNTIEEEGMTHTDPEKVSSKAAEYFESAFSHSYADMSYLSELEAPRMEEMIKKEYTEITVEEVRNAVKWLRNRKCPGPDGIHNEMLKMPVTESRDYSWELAEVLAHLFNNILVSGVFPTVWKECTIIPAYKKGSAQDIANYRPICLLSSVAKLFTRLLNTRVSKAAEAASIFTNTQGGGRKFRDIREKLSIMRGVIDHANRNDSQLYLLLTDIAKAFDSVPHNAIREVYSFFGFPSSIVGLVHDMVTNNWARVMTGTLSRRFSIGKGTRQGDSLSPTTYVLVHQTVLLYTARLAKGYPAGTQNIWNVAYVDDCNLMSSDRNDIEMTANRMNEVLGKLKMTMHPTKLELYVRKHGKTPSDHNIMVNGVVVAANGSRKVFRALGLFTNLNGCTVKQKEQARDKVERVIKRLHIMRLTARQVARIVNTCIHPVFLYASEFTEWGAGWINRVNHIGKALIKRGSVAMRRYPSELLHVACDNGGFGLRRFEESLLVNTAWFIINMLKGKHDGEAHRLLLDTLEEIRHLQTFQVENVFQSNNRIELVAHSYLKWCAVRMHTNHLTISCGNEVNCLSCNLALSQPNDIIKRLFKVGIGLRSQLTVGGKWIRHSELIKRHGNFGISSRRYKYLTSDLEMLQCNGNHEHSADTTPRLMYNDSFEVVEKEQLWRVFLRRHRDRVKEEKVWWIQSKCLGGAVDFKFMRCPFRVDRALEWFVAQVKSHTIHTKAVVQHLYGVVDMDTLCPKCKFEQETVLHCLVRCPVAIMARKLLVKEVSTKLSKMGLHKDQRVDMWFDNQRWSNGALLVNKRRKTSKEYMLGMLGIETRALKQVIKGLTKSGIEKKKAREKAQQFVDHTKRRCVEVMRRLFTSSKEIAGWLLMLYEH